MRIIILGKVDFVRDLLLAHCDCSFQNCSGTKEKNAPVPFRWDRSGNYASAVPPGLVPHGHPLCAY